MKLNLQHEREGFVCVGEAPQLGFFVKFNAIPAGFVVVEVKHFPIFGGELNRCELEKKADGIERYSTLCEHDPTDRCCERFNPAGGP